MKKVFTGLAANGGFGFEFVREGEIPVLGGDNLRKLVFKVLNLCVRGRGIEGRDPSLPMCGDKFSERRWIRKDEFPGHVVARGAGGGCAILRV